MLVMRTSGPLSKSAPAGLMARETARQYRDVPRNRQRISPEGGHSVRPPQRTSASPDSRGGLSPRSTLVRSLRLARPLRKGAILAIEGPKIGRDDRSIPGKPVTIEKAAMSCHVTIKDPVGATTRITPQRTSS